MIGPSPSTLYITTSQRLFCLFCPGVGGQGSGLLLHALPGKPRSELVILEETKTSPSSSRHLALPHLPEGIASRFASWSQKAPPTRFLLKSLWFSGRSTGSSLRERKREREKERE
ncbi:unnamed protein product [Gadus morhua 'NCC']